MAGDPESVGPYKLGRVLGRGGMGVVHEARDERLGRTVAVKLLAPDRDASEAALKRFEREALAAGSVRHPNVGVIHDILTVGRTRALVLELLPGGSVLDRIKKDGRIGWREAAALGAKIASALVAIHGAGLVHRDLKPANVLFDDVGEPRVCDFGMARYTAFASSLSKSGQLVGTLEYLAPELAEGGAAVGPAVDLYALGATLHHMLTGAYVFHGTGFALITQHLRATPPSVRATAPEVPERFAALVLRLLAKDPKARGDALGAQRELELLAKLETKAPPPPRRAVPIAVGVILAVAVLGTGAVVFRARPIAAPSTPAAPAPPPTPSPPPPASPAPGTAIEGPDWYRQLRDGERPTLRRGIRFGKSPGEYLNEADGSVLVYVPGGTFPFGGPLDGEKLWGKNHGQEGFAVAGKASPPREDVSVRGFFIGKYEVSVAEYTRYVDAQSPIIPGHEAVDFDPITANWVDTSTTVTWRNPDGFSRDEAKLQDPVCCLTFEEARRYCAWAHVRIPTEVEWEKAALWDPRARHKNVYPWGDEVPDAAHPRANYRDLSLRKKCPGAKGNWPHADGWETRAPVGAMAEDVSPCKARDMAGNVMEFVEDTRGAAPDGKVLARGGGWFDYPEWTPPGLRNNNMKWDGVRRDLGFRIAVDE